MTPTYFFLATHEICQIDSSTIRLQYITCQCIAQPQQAIIMQDTALFTEQHRCVTHRSTYESNQQDATM